MTEHVVFGIITGTVISAFGIAYVNYQLNRALKSLPKSEPELIPEQKRESKTKLEKPEIKVSVAFIGAAGSGKSTATAHVVKMGAIEEYFAKPVKQISSILLTGDSHPNPEVASPELFDPVLKERTMHHFYDLTPRRLMQFIGTDLFRDQLARLSPELANGIWVKLMERRIENIRNPIVISDMRFLNEAEWFRFRFKKQGIIIKLVRAKSSDSDIITTSGRSQQEITRHVSEQEFEKIEPDYTIENTGTVEELHKKIGNILSKFG